MDNSLEPATGTIQTEVAEPDSPNAAFKRFRDTDPNDSDSDDGSGHKRRRVSAQEPKHGSQPGVTLSDNLAIGSTATSTSPGQGLAPARFNWNAGTKTTIGTSLKNRKRTNIVESGIASSSANPGQ